MNGVATLEKTGGVTSNPLNSSNPLTTGERIQATELLAQLTNPGDPGTKNVIHARKTMFMAALGRKPSPEEAQLFAANVSLADILRRAVDTSPIDRERHDAFLRGSLLTRERAEPPATKLSAGKLREFVWQTRLTIAKEMLGRKLTRQEKRMLRAGTSIDQLLNIKPQPETVRQPKTRVEPVLVPT